MAVGIRCHWRFREFSSCARSKTRAPRPTRLSGRISVMDARAGTGIDTERSTSGPAPGRRAVGWSLQTDFCASDGVAEFADCARDSGRAARRIRSRRRRSADARRDAGRGRSGRPRDATPSPRCLVHRRISEPGGVRQAYLVFFDAPEIVQFRRQIGLDPDALSPIMFVAGAGTDFNSWLPQRIDAEAECLAPIGVAP